MISNTNTPPHFCYLAPVPLYRQAELADNAVLTKPQPKKRSEPTRLPPSPCKPSVLPSPPKQQQSPKNKRLYLGNDINAVEKEKLLSDLERELPPTMGFDKPKEGKPPENTVAALPCATDHKYPSAAQIYKSCKMKTFVDRFWRTNATGIYAVFLA